MDRKGDSDKERTFSSNDVCIEDQDSTASCFHHLLNKFIYLCLINYFFLLVCYGWVTLTFLLILLEELVSFNTLHRGSLG